MKTGFVVTVRRQIATTTALTSSQNPTKVGHSVTFTATVRATGSNIIPTGTIVFRDGSRELGSAALEGTGQATYSTSSLDEASHNITAFYQGNASFDPSTSPVLIQKIEAEKKDDDKKKDEEKKKKKEKEEQDKKEKDDNWKDDDEEEDDDPGVIRHHDHDDLDHLCRHFRHDNFDEDDESGSSRHHRRERSDRLRRLCAQWHRENRHVTLVDKGIRRHVEGYYDHGGGHRSHWDSHHHRHGWVPGHRHEYHEHYKPHKKFHHKKHHYVKPVHHFAVTG
ncbi:Ig-like domain-containing protein [Sphaerisporangium album]|uniref:Ig-like domain-containing protein n=1 Tax=Sphaerisporangium album TaxID=509200 RepID=UPI0015EFE4A0|nr:Ig-like domain-containing protein [Sphaerisporangium album]